MTTLAALVVAAVVCATAAPNTIEAGQLKLQIVTADSAQVFHAVDQMSAWSQYCHRQYRRWFESAEGGGLSEADLKLLSAHAAVRGRLGYGVLDQTFYRADAWEPALDAAVKAKKMSREDAATEKKVFRHFEPRVMKLVETQHATVEAAAASLVADAPKLRAFAEQASAFWGGGAVDLPMYLVVTPAGGGGGGLNGGKLVVEVGDKQSPVGVAMHEAWHAFAEAQSSALHQAATEAGTDWETLSEGLAYAVSPGLYFSANGASDELAMQVQRDFKAEKSFSSEPYVRFNRLGLSLRPSLKDAFATQETFASFLPKAIAVYRGLAEVALALEKQGTRPRYFFFGEGELFKPLTAEIVARGFDVWGRRLQVSDYEALKAKMHSSDTVVYAAPQKAMLDLAEKMQGEWGDQWPVLRAQVEKSPRGQFRAVTERGPRVAAWSNDAASLPQVVSTEAFRQLLLSDSRTTAPKP